MKTLIYCFSATGNSLTTARLLAAGLEDCSVVGLASLLEQETIPVEADAVGFVYPVYYGDMPHLMRRIIDRMTFSGHPYIFSVCTCKGHHGDVAARLDTLLRQRGQHLSFSRHVPMPGNSRLSPHEKNAEMLSAQEDTIAAILQDLRTFPTEDHRPATAPQLTPVHEASNMRGMEAESHCVGCGTCEQACPMQNIRLVEGRPVIGDDCISCLTCFHWCPQEAIWMSRAEEEMKRRFKYHHPAITLDDILALKEVGRD